VDVFEAALPGVAFGGGVKREQPLPAFARRAGARIEQEIGFRGQPTPRMRSFVALGFSPVSRNSFNGTDAALKGGATFSSSSASLVTKSGLRKSGSAYSNPCDAWMARSAARSLS